MALSIVAIWFAVLFLGLFGPTYEVVSAGEGYGLKFEIRSLAVPVGYVAGITTLFIILPMEKIMGKVRTYAQKRYAWVTLSIVAIWVAVLFAGLLGLSYEVAVAEETETVLLAVPVAFFALVATVILAKYVTDFGLGLGE